MVKVRVNAKGKGEVGVCIEVRLRSSYMKPCTSSLPRLLVHRASSLFLALAQQRPSLHTRGADIWGAARGDVF